MIWITKRNGQKSLLNADWIQSVEETPDTVVTLTNGETLLVQESANGIMEKVIEFKKKVFRESQREGCSCGDTAHKGELRK